MRDDYGQGQRASNARQGALTVDEENIVLRRALRKAKEHFDMLAGLAEAQRITDTMKRKKWEIVRDEAKAGSEFLSKAIS